MDQRLLGQVIGILDRSGHPLHREEGGQVGGVGGDDDQGEEPPDSTNYSCGSSSEIHSSTNFKSRNLKTRITDSYVEIPDRPICEHLPRIKVRPLLHERAHGEPEAVGEGEVVLDDVARVHARVRGRPLVRRKSV